MFYKSLTVWSPYSNHFDPLSDHFNGYCGIFGKYRGSNRGGGETTHPPRFISTCLFIYGSIKTFDIPEYRSFFKKPFHYKFDYIQCKKIYKEYIDELGQPMNNSAHCLDQDYLEQGFDLVLM